jgi:hypothetical protein
MLRNAFRIPIFECPGYEADDVLGTLANKAVDDGWRVRILTGDQDLFQLVDDIRDIACLYLESKSHKYANSIRPMDADRVLAKLGVVPSSIVDFKALVGDSSDNFPGVKGIGSKTASGLLREHKTLDSIYASLDQSLTIGPTVKKKLYDDREAAYHCQFLAKIKVDVPLDTPISWELAQVDVETLADNLQELNLKYLQGRFCDLIKIFSNNVQCHEFDLKLQLLLAFRQREGHSNVPQKQFENGVNLGKWLSSQRACHRKGLLHADRQVQLEEAGVLWHLRKGDFDLKLQLLLVFRQREGHSNVTQKHVENGVNLGKWLSSQRACHRKGLLHAARQVQLEEAGVLWHLPKGNFDLKLQLLLAFTQREGHSNVPQKHVENGVNLGQWLSSQRACHRKGRLHADRQVQLEEAGVLWHLPKGFLQTDNFKVKLQLLLAFRQREGHSNAPQRKCLKTLKGR